MDKTQVFGMFKKRDENANKGSFGRALIIAGSYGMAGAAVIAAKAAVLSGVGICDIACEQSVYPIISAGIPEAVCTPISKDFNADDKKRLKQSLKRADCVVIGCGMGNTDYTDKILREVSELCNVPIIIDADALNVLSKDLSILKSFKCNVIVTPHPGEMCRLSKISVSEINSDRVKCATEFSKKYGVVTLLKGKNTVISDENGEYSINTSGNAGMATGGSGDMLCGVIAALVCDGFSAFNAACAGAFIHGYAGDFSAQKYSQHSTCANTMLKLLPKVFLEIESGL